MRKLMVLAAFAAIATPALAKVPTFVSADAIASPAGVGTVRAVNYSTGFEPGAGFVAGSMATPGTGLAPEGPWVSGGANTLSPVISTAHPAGGLQHERHKDAGTANGTLRLGFSPQFGPSLGTSVVSFDVSTSYAGPGSVGGADYQVILQSPNAGNTSVTARMGFSYYYGGIYVLGTAQGTAALAYFDTGAALPDSGYHNIKLVINGLGNNIDYYLDNVLIYSDTVVNFGLANNPNPGAVGQIVTADDQYQDFAPGGTATDTGDFDNFSVTPEPTTVALLVMGVAALARRRR